LTHACLDGDKGAYLPFRVVLTPLREDPAWCPDMVEQVDPRSHLLGIVTGRDQCSKLPDPMPRYMGSSDRFNADRDQCP